MKKLSPIPFPKPHPHLGFETTQITVRWEDAKFFRSWLVYDSDLEVCRSGGSVNWNVVAGLVLMAVVSASGWYGISLLVRHLIR